MKFKLILFFIFCFSLFHIPVVRAQVSTAGMSGRAIDSMNAARKKALESAAALRKYRSSKHYKDSLTKARKLKANTLKANRESKVDSMKQARQKITDSTLAIRKVKTDSIKTIQKTRAEKVAKVKKYKASRRYTDSVTMVRREHLDSTKRVQKAFRDSVARVRRTEMGVAKSIRKREADSMKAVRTKFSDSLKIVRKKRVDSLARVKADRDKKLKSKDKVSEEKKKLAFELLMKKKHEAFTNQSMLKKKWSPFRRFTQNSFTHYNYYYNANRKMEEANANMLRGGMKENYDSLIRLYPFDPDRDSSLLKGDMDTIIRKVSVGLQIHDPRVKWSNDMFLLMGQAYYFKGNYENAATSFRYIISADEEAKKKEGGHTKGGPSIVEDEHSRLDFLKHKSVHNDAILWLARTYVQEKYIENGQAVLSLLSSDPHLPEDMIGKVAAGKAFAYLADKNTTAAIEQLNIVIEDDNLPNWLRMRAAFLNGLLLQSAEKYDAATANFERCLDFFPKIDMDFYARKYIALNTLLAGKDVEDGMKPLKKVLNDGKYVSYYDQVYYAIGSLAAKANKPDEAIKYLTLSATAPKSTKKQKAISFAALGDAYYSQGKYTDAKNSYDSAAKYSGSNNKDKNVTAAIQKSKGLSEVSQPAMVIHDQDSLLALSELTKKEQTSAVRKYLRDLEKQMKDSIQNAEDAGVTAIATSDASSDPATAEASNWYFANPTTMQQGAAEFKRKWGSRPLTDNWQRSAALGNNTSAGSNGGIEETETSQDNSSPVNGLPSEESLLAKIPNTKEQKEFAIKITQRAYIMLAKAYMRQLDDYVQASATLDTLDARYPNHNQKEEELFVRYQLAIRQSKLDVAQKYSDELLSKFPNSQYSAVLKPKKEEKATVVNGGKTVAQYYDETYQLIDEHKYAEALVQVTNGMKTYDDPTFKKRFQVAEALCYAGQANYNMADTLITKFIAANGADSLAGWATSIKAYIVDVRKNGLPYWYNDTAVPESGKAAAKKLALAPKAEVKPPPPPPPPPDVPRMFTYAPTEDHAAVLLLGTVDSRMGPLKSKIKAIDSALGIAGNTNVIIDLYSTDQILVLIKPFAGADKANGYLDSLNAHDAFKDYKPTEIKKLIVSSKNYKRLFFEKDFEKYMNFYNTYYKKPE